MQVDFKNKVVVVTGAASGIGRATAERFCQLGAHVYALDVKQDSLDSVVDAMLEAGYQADRIVADVGNPGEWYPQLASVPRIDVLCNVAAIIDPSELKIDEAMNMIASGGLRGLKKLETELQDVVATNYRGPYLLSLFAAQKMRGSASPARPDDADGKKERRGVIINVGSTNVFTQNERRLVYAPLKAALHMLTELMAKGLAKYGIRVNCVAPGATAGTGMVGDEQDAQRKMPLGINTVDDVVDAIVYLASDYARNVTGEVLKIDGGRTVSR